MKRSRAKSVGTLLLSLLLMANTPLAALQVNAEFPVPEAATNEENVDASLAEISQADAEAVEAELPEEEFELDLEDGEDFFIGIEEETEAEVEPEAEQEPVTEVEIETEAEPEPVTEVETEPEPVQEVETKPEAESEPVTEVEIESEAEIDPAPEVESVEQDEQRLEDEAVEPIEILLEEETGSVPGTEIVEDEKPVKTEELIEAETDEEKQTIESETDLEEEWESEELRLNADASSKIAELQKYTYEIIPVLLPFDYYLYLKTDNPDISNIRLVDADSTLNTGTDPAVFEVYDRVFDDVTYENEATYRVRGGYILYGSGNSDGGTLKIEVEIGHYERTDSGYYKYVEEYADTSLTIDCPPLKNRAQYLVDTYTTDSMSFFEKLDAVEKGLNEISLYPYRLVNGNKPNPNQPYPFYATSIYKELDLNEYYSNMFAGSAGILGRTAYPFILDSSGFPGVMSRVAEYLDSSCEVKANSNYHWLIDVTYGGETRSYGGAGTGSAANIFPTNKADELYTFTNSPTDYLGTASLEMLYQKNKEYTAIAETEMKQYEGYLKGDAFNEAIGNGAWAKVSTEPGFGTLTGFSTFGTTYTYLTLSPGQSSPWVVSDTWVDGRYVSAWEKQVLGATFEDYPTAGILLRNQTYTDMNGNAHTGDMWFKYEAEDGKWKAKSCYYQRNWYSSRDPELPEEFIMTRDQVKAIADSHTDFIPDSGVIYDGTVYPGTPFSINHVTSITLPERVNVIMKNSAPLEVTISPESANDQTVIFESSDSSIAYVSYFEEYGGYFVQGQTPGIATITATTKDGGYTATCEVIVMQGVTGVSLDRTSFELYIGSSETLQATVEPEMAANKKVIWSSSNPEIAFVDENGKVTGVAKGYTNITATTEDQGKTASCSCYVLQPVTGVTLDQTNLIIDVGISNILIATVLPEDANNLGISWSSDNENVASVNVGGWKYGVVTAVAPGTATITVKTDDQGKEETCLVTVRPLPENLTLDKTEIELSVGETAKLNATVTPENANQVVQWISYDDNIATIDTNGNLTAVGKGSVWVYARTNSGYKYAYCRVSVRAPLPDIKLEQEGSYVYTGSEIKPAVMMNSEDGVQLVENFDYTLSYSNNVEVGTATVTVTGVGNYAGSKNVTFRIEAAPLADIQLQSEKVVYTGKELKPKTTVKNSAGTVLTLDTDYTVSYADNIRVGTAKVTVTGTGNYTGTLQATFKIKLPFTDVPDDYVYYDEIADIYMRGLMTGMTPTTFAPEITLNRAFMAAVLFRRAG